MPSNKQSRVVQEKLPEPPGLIEFFDDLVGDMFDVYDGPEDDADPLKEALEGGEDGEAQRSQGNKGTRRKAPVSVQGAGVGPVSLDLNKLFRDALNASGIQLRRGKHSESEPGGSESSSTETDEEEDKATG